MQRMMLRGFSFLFIYLSLSSIVHPGTKLKISGNVNNGSVVSRSATLLNQNITADAFNYSRLTMDLNFDFLGTDSTSKNEDDWVIMAHSTIRAKSNWGNVYESLRTESAQVPMGKGLLFGDHSHRGTKPPIWIRELSLETRLDKIIGLNPEFVIPNDSSKQNQFGHASPRSNLKIGYFFYHLGRGIAFGPGYGTSKAFLGVYNRQNDFAAPGVLLSNRVGPLVLDLYFCKYESRSASFKETMAPKRARLTKNSIDPWAGAGMDENLYAAKLEYLIDRGAQVKGKAYTFVFFNDAPARKTEFESDAASGLGSAGIGSDLAIGDFEFGFEADLNFGKEARFELDRNDVSEVRDAFGNHVQAYSHIIDTVTGKKALVTDSLSAYIDSNLQSRMLPNGTLFLGQYTNDAKRIRPAYETAYRGYAFVADAAYSFFSKDRTRVVKLAGEVGVLSGDKNPSTKESSGDLGRDYRGFVGLDEVYSGSRVKSIIMLDDRSTRRPMTIDQGTKVGEATVISDSTFTDMIYYGFGGNYKIGQTRGVAPDLSLNVLSFYKFDLSKKIGFDSSGNPVVSDNDARRHLGVECNAILRFAFECGLTLSLVGAYFLPGGYYTDIKGARIKDDAISYLTPYAVNAIPARDLSISDNRSLYGKLEVGYRF